MTDIKGQILENSLFAYYIDQIIKENLPKNIVEIGTWKGLGSTKRIIDSIINYQITCNFLSLETHLTFYNEAKNNLNIYKNYVQLIYGTIININDIQHFVSTLALDPIQKQWLDSDITDLSIAPYVFDIMPEKIDFLLLDGGEFSTYAEWQKLKNRSSIIALDDTNVTKCQKIKTEILQQSNTYEIIIDSNDRNGFLFCKNKSLL